MAGLGNMKLDDKQNADRLERARSKTASMEAAQNRDDQASPTDKLLGGNMSPRNIMDLFSGKSSTQGLNRPRMTDFIK